MKHTKLKSIAFALMLGLGVNTTQASGIPTVDGAAIANQIQTWVIEAQRWKQQIQQYKQDFENQKNQLLTEGKQLASMTGVRDIVGFMNEAKSILNDVKNLDKWLNQTDKILAHGKDILSNDLKSLFDKYGIGEQCKSFVSKAQQKNCEGEIVIQFIKEKQIEKTAKKLEGRIKTIQGIAKRMEKAKDVKEAQDLSNAMQSQIALLNADKIALDLMAKTEELSKNIADKQRKEHNKKILENELKLLGGN